MIYYRKLKNNKKVYYDSDGYFQCEKENESSWSHSQAKTGEKYKMIESEEEKIDSNGDEIKTVVYRTTKVKKDSKLKCVCGKPLIFKGYHAWVTSDDEVVLEKYFENKKEMMKWFNSFD